MDESCYIVKIIKIDKLYCPDCYIEEFGLKPYKKPTPIKNRFELLDF